MQKYVGAEWTEHLSASQLHLCDKEFIERDYEGREADILYEVTSDDENMIYIFVLQELQSSVDFTIIFRILIYIVNTLLRYFLAADRKEREKKSFRIPAMVPIIFYNGAEEWTAVRSLKEYQKEGDLFGEHILNLQYYLVDLNTVEEEYILSTNTVLDNIMYCDKFRMKEQLANALRKAFKRVSALDKQEQEAFQGWVKHILMEVCEYKESVADEIINWAGNGVNDMSFQYNIVRMFEKEREEGREEGENCFAILTEKLLKDSRMDDLTRAVNDKEYRNTLYYYYGLKI